MLALLVLAVAVVVLHSLHLDRDDGLRWWRASVDCNDTLARPAEVVVIAAVTAAGVDAVTEYAVRAVVEDCARDVSIALRAAGD